MRDGKPRWVNYMTEFVYYDGANQIVGRIVKKGCCWLAYVGTSAFTCGRFRDIDSAKRAVERTLKLEAMSDAG